ATHRVLCRRSPLSLPDPPTPDIYTLSLHDALPILLDCYRPTRAVAHFVRWARDRADVTRKADHYPEVDKRDLFRLGYIAERSGQDRKSTRLNSSHGSISYAVFCLKKKNQIYSV